MNVYENPKLCRNGKGIMNPGGQKTTLRLLELGRPYGGTDALDVGTGTGQSLITLAEWGFVPVGLESSQKLAHMAQKSCPEASIVIGKAESMPFCDDRFDLILFQCVLSITDIDRALAETYRILRSDGKLLIQDLAGTAEGEGCLGGCLTIARWIQRIDDSGFRITRIEQVPGAVRNYWASSIFNDTPFPKCDSSPRDVEAFACCATKKLKNER